MDYLFSVIVAPRPSNVAELMDLSLSSIYFVNNLAGAYVLTLKYDMERSHETKTPKMV